jgi:hypothetical protein
MFDIKKAATEMIKEPEVIDAINKAMDDKFRATFKSLMGPMAGLMNTEPDEAMLKEHREKLWEHGDPWTLISIYAPEYDKKLWDMMAEEEENRVFEEANRVLKELGIE